MGAAVAIIVRKQREHRRGVSRARATSLETARYPDELGIDESMIFHGLVRRAVLRDAGDGRYYRRRAQLGRDERAFATALHVWSRSSLAARIFVATVRHQTNLNSHSYDDNTLRILDAPPRIPWTDRRLGDRARRHRLCWPRSTSRRPPPAPAPATPYAHFAASGSHDDALG